MNPGLTPILFTLLAVMLAGGSMRADAGWVKVDALQSCLPGDFEIRIGASSQDIRLGSDVRIAALRKQINK